MKAAGLQVVTLDAKAVGEFRAAAEKLSCDPARDMIPADIYDLAVRERDAFRNAKAVEMTPRGG